MTTTASQHRATAARHDADAAASFERCDTDGFLSQWASGINAQVARANAAIADNGGLATFWAYEVHGLDGSPLTFRRANTRYGFKLVVDIDGREVWIDPDARKATNERKGALVTRREFTAEAHAATWAPSGARGTGGATSVVVRTFPNDRAVRFDGVSS
jgi:hypothetical protein